MQPFFITGGNSMLRSRVYEDISICEPDEEVAESIFKIKSKSVKINLGIQFNELMVMIHFD